MSPPAPARHFDTRTTAPISFFLSGLEELLAWQPNGDDDFNVSAVPLAKCPPLLRSQRPQTLVCHDMRGGYLEDRYVLGGGAMWQRGSTSQPPNLFCLISFLLAWPPAGGGGGVWFLVLEHSDLAWASPKPGSAGVAWCHRSAQLPGRESGSCPAPRLPAGVLPALPNPLPSPALQVHPGLGHTQPLRLLPLAVH